MPFDPIIIESSPPWFTLAGWLVLCISFILLLVNFVLQINFLKKASTQALSEYQSAIVIFAGWISFIVATSMTWYGLHCTWYGSAIIGESLSESRVSSILNVNYAQSVVPGFIGILIWASAFCEAALFKALWIRKLKMEHNQPPERTG